MPVDILGREIKVDDFVVFYSNLYQVIDVSNHAVRIELVEKAKTTKPTKAPSTKVAIVDRDDVLIHLLKNGKV